MNVLFKKRVDDLLLLLHKFLSLLEPVRLALDVNRSAVMQDAVKDGRGNGDVSKDLILLRKSLVGGENGGSIHIVSGDELKTRLAP